MKTSDQINELAAALALAQGTIDDAIADAENPHYRSTYADLASIRAAIRLPFNQNGLSLSQWPTTIDGKPALTTRLMHKSGQWMEDTAQLIIEKPTMQGFGSAITYMRRYSASAIAGLAENDDDGNDAEKHPVKKAAASAPAKAVVTPKNTTAHPPVTGQTTKPGAGITDKQRKFLWAKIKEIGYSDESAKNLFQKISGKAHSADWTRDDFDKVLLEIDRIAAQGDAYESNG